MTELIRTYQTPLKESVTTTLENLKAFPVYNPKKPQEMGFRGRKDSDPIEPQEMLEAILYEGMNFAGLDRVDIGNNQEMLIFNSSVASPHTILTVPYDDFDSTFRQKADEIGITLPHSILIEGAESNSERKVPPAEVPLDILTWVMIYDKNLSQLRTTDISDFRSDDSGSYEIDKFKLHLSDEKMDEVYEAIIRRGALASTTLLDLYNNVIRTKYPIPKTNIEEEQDYHLPEKKAQDILQGVANGYYRWDKVKGLKQSYYDGRGFGPMSNPTLHFRYTCHLDPELLNQLNMYNTSISFEQLINRLAKRPEVFGNSVQMVHTKPRTTEDESQGDVLKQLFSVYSAEDILKVVDPYGSLVHDHLEKWLEEELRALFKEQNATVSGFKHHTNEYERTLRVNEGAEITIPPISDVEERNKVLAAAFRNITDYIGKRLYPLWDEVNQYVENKIVMSEQERVFSLYHLSKDYNLPEGAVYAITNLMPTRVQLENVQKRYKNGSPEYARIQKALSRYEVKSNRVKNEKKLIYNRISAGKGSYQDLIDLVYLEQRSQLFEPISTKENSTMNKGYNMPGVPGNAITYTIEEDGSINLSIGWLLSTKGLAETWLGAVIKRLERAS